MQPNHEELWFEIRQRDGGMCLECAAEGRETLAVAIHHIVHRGQYAEELIWRPENMISLCADCHSRADSGVSRSKHLKILKRRYGYFYEHPRWLSYI